MTDTMTDTEVSDSEVTPAPPRAPIETRSARITGVDFPQRIIDLVAVPWDEWAMVEYPAFSGKFIEESFQRGAFGNIQNRAHRFLVNLEHDVDRVVGRVHAMYPERPEGLVTELRIRRGPEGDQVLQDADDNMLGGSVGFAVLPENTKWETRSRRKILKAFLGHVALTFNPTYAGAVPLAVRSRTAVNDGSESTRESTLRLPTPNLDMILAERLAKQYGL